MYEFCRSPPNVSQVFFLHSALMPVPHTKWQVNTLNLLLPIKHSLLPKVLVYLVCTIPINLQRTTVYNIKTHLTFKPSKHFDPVVSLRLQNVVDVKL